MLLQVPLWALQAVYDWGLVLPAVLCVHTAQVHACLQASQPAGCILRFVSEMRVMSRNCMSESGVEEASKLTCIGGGEATVLRLPNSHMTDEQSTTELCWVVATAWKLSVLCCRGGEGLLCTTVEVVPVNNA